MNKLVKGLQAPGSLAMRGTTANGAVTLTTTGSELVDFFGVAGASRNMPAEELVGTFRRAYGADALDAMKLLFYTRDVRGGAGERRAFREIIQAAAMEDSRRDSVKANLENIPFFGRWDDLFVLMGTPLEGDVVNLVKRQLDKDLAATEKNSKAGEDGLRHEVSLLGKWMPSINTSSKETKKLASKFAKAFGWSPASYRKRLARLRKEINVLERLLSARKWSDIDYGKIPSRAGMLYRKAFFKRDEERYSLFQKDVSEGKETVNAGTLYPHEIIQRVRSISPGRCWYYDDPSPDMSAEDLVRERLVLDNYWKALGELLDFLTEEPTLVCCDTSGSMQVTIGSSKVSCLDVAVGLAILFAERMKNEAFRNKFISFSSDPRLQTVTGEDIYEKFQNVEEIVENTNFQKIFDLILEVGVRESVPASDMPRRVVVISDMEFDHAQDHRGDGFGKTNLEVLREKYANSSYDIPELVYWNVNARADNFPMSTDDAGTCLISGYSPAVFQSVLSAEVVTPADVMRAAIDSERYDCVRA